MQTPTCTSLRIGHGSARHTLSNRLSESARTSCAFRGRIQCSARYLVHHEHVSRPLTPCPPRQGPPLSDEGSARARGRHASGIQEAAASCADDATRMMPSGWCLSIRQLARAPDGRPPRRELSGTRAVLFKAYRCGLAYGSAPLPSCRRTRCPWAGAASLSSRYGVAARGRQPTGVAEALTS